MRGELNLKELNEIATVQEYQKALQDGATEKAERIEAANPDLKYQFQAVETVCA